MPTNDYKLTYFPIRGRAEFIRYIFALAETPFKEEIINFDDWPARKIHTMFGTLPMLEINRGELVINQSLTIGRYLAKHFGIAGRNVWEQALADSYVEGWSDLLTSYGAIVDHIVLGGNYIAARNEYQKFKEENLKPYLSKYQKFINANPTRSGWLVGNKITWADIYVGEFIDRMMRIYDENLLNDYPELERFLTRLNNLPAIKIHIASRPVDYQM